MGGTLTVSERILYHLNSYVKFGDKFEVPFDVTQDGISQAVSISRAHAAIEIKKLRSLGMVDERLSHVRKGKSRRKAYFLTHAGKAHAATIAQYILENGVDPMVDPSKVVPMSNASSRARSSRKSSPIPELGEFHGRSKELAELSKALDDPSVKIVSVRGMSGIGKTALAARLASDLTGQRVFWHTSKPWDVPRTVTEAMARFFQDNGCKRLSTYMASEHMELGELSVLLNEELSENGYTFVFDDADCAPGLQDFLYMFRHSSGTAKMMVTSENVPRFYEHSDVVARGEVFELELGGLDKKSALRVLDSRGIRGDSAEQLVKLTKGHPLSLEMITVSGLSEARTQVARFLEDKYYAGLSESERSLLQLASVFNKPFPMDAIPRGLRGSRKGSMLREVAPGRFEIHASVRGFVYDSMDPDERTSWHSSAADHYLRDGDVQERLYHLMKSNRTLEAEMLVARQAGSLLDRGNVQRLWEVIGEYVPKKERYSRSVLLLKAKAADMVGEHPSALSILGPLSEDGSPVVRAEALTEMGLILSRKGDLDEASHLLRRAMSASSDNPGARSRALRGLGVIEDKLGNHKKAQELLEASARDAMGAVDARGMLLAHLELGNLFMGRGMYEEAISHFSKCAAGFGPVDLASVLTSMGVACSRLGRLEEARLHLENAVRLCSETGQPRSRAYAHTSLAEVLTRSGEYERARECCFAALEVFTELEDKAGVSAAYSSLGNVDRLGGAIGSSEENYRESVSALEGTGLKREQGLRRLELAELLSMKGDTGSAMATLDEAESIFAACGAKDMANETRRRKRSLGRERRPKP